MFVLLEIWVLNILLDNWRIYVMYHSEWANLKDISFYYGDDMIDVDCNNSQGIPVRIPNLYTYSNLQENLTFSL